MTDLVLSDEEIAQLTPDELADYEAILAAEVAGAAGTLWRAQARPEQLPPEGDWFIWALIGGRGSGKSRSGAEWLAEELRASPLGEWAIIAPTFADARDTCVEGPAGLLSALGGERGPHVKLWNRSIGEVILRGGGVVRIAGADDHAVRVQGKNLRGAWCDELGLWRGGGERAWDESLLPAVRIGQPKIVVTTTPKPTRLVRRLLADSGVRVSRMTTFDNAANLSDQFLDQMRERYSGTRLGRQELQGELLEDVEGALWRREWIDDHRVEEAPECRTLVIGLDPADGIETGDEQALCLAGVGLDRQLYVFVSEGVRDTPMVWLTRAVQLGRDMAVKALIIEKNHGGQFLVGLLEQAMEKTDVRVPYQVVDARSGKRTRAEPIAALFEQGKVHMVGHHPLLEEQLVTWTGESGQASPDRLDSMTWALTDLMGYARSGTADMGSAVPYTDDPRVRVEGGAVPWEGARWERESEVLYLPR